MGVSIGNQESDGCALKPSPGLSLALGLWLGATLVIIPVIAYNFQGIQRSVKVNDKLARNLDVPANRIYDRDVRRSSILFVYAGELNRAQFYAWNRAQLVLAAACLLLALLRFPSRTVIFMLMGASLLVLALTFYMAPEVTSMGRELDLVPTETPGKEALFARFASFHRNYIVLEGAKTLLLVVAIVPTLWKPREES